MTKKSFMQGAVILGIAGLFIKLLGAFFRIPLVNMIGTEAMSYYQSAYPVYVFFLTLATAGIPIAISKMVSERIATDRYYEANRVYRISFVLLLIIGIASSSICFFGAGWITRLMRIPEAVYSMKAIAPALLFVPLMASFRGYFQGMQDMKPTAVSQTVEQLFRVVCGLFLAYYLTRVSLEYAAAGAAFGATAGAVMGLLATVIVYLYKRGGLQANIKRTKRPKEENASSILAKIIIIAVPITVGASIMPIMNGIDAMMVIRVLTDTGWTYNAAKDMYGQLTAMVGSLINFPQVLTQAVSMSLVPAISIAFRQRDMAFVKDNVKLGLRTALIIGFPCAFGFMTIAEPILLMIYPLQKASAMSAASCLVILGAGVIFLSTVQTLTGVLQGIGKQMIPVRNLAIGAVAKVALSYYLVSIPGIDVKGAAVGTVTAYIIASTLNLIAVKRYTGVKFDFILTYVKPLVSALAMAAIVWVSQRLFSAFVGNAVGTLLSIMIGALVYGYMLFLVKAITKEEVARLPRGNKIVKIMNKFVK